MNMYEKTKKLFNNSKLKLLLDERKNIIIKINTSLKISVVMQGVFLLFAIIGMGLTFHYNSMIMLFLTMGLLLMSILSPLTDEKIKRYNEKKYGLDYKMKEIKQYFNSLETQKELFDYLKELEKSYNNPNLTCEIENLKILFMEYNEENTENIIELMEKILYLEKNLHKDNSLKNQLLEYNKKINWINENNQEIEYSSDLKKIL